MKQTCELCGKEIDLSMCDCGIPLSEHTRWDGHSPMPARCDCGEDPVEYDLDDDNL
jgi:hypothetical protein